MQAVNRIFAVLRVVADHPEGIGVLTIAEKIKLPKSTTSRLLSALEDEGALRREGRRFFIGTAVSSLIPQTTSPTQILANRAKPYLQALCDETRETVLLAVKTGDNISYALHLQTQHAVQLRPWQTEQLPLHVLAAGKLFLAYASDEEREAYLKERPLTPFTDHSIIDANVLRTELATYRTQGFAITDEEFAEGVMGIGIPLIDNAELTAAICLYGPRFRLAGRPMILETVAKMKATAKKIATAQ